MLLKGLVLTRCSHAISSAFLFCAECLALNLSMKFASFATPSIGIALYREARQPPTERWPARFVIPSAFVSAKNCFVRLASSPLMTNGTFMRDRQFLSTGQE